MAEGAVGLDANDVDFAGGCGGGGSKKSSKSSNVLDVLVAG